jgi:hypothetical protein
MLFMISSYEDVSFKEYKTSYSLINLSMSLNKSRLDISTLLSTKKNPSLLTQQGIFVFRPNQARLSEG